MEHDKNSVSVKEVFKKLRKQIIEGAAAGGRAQRIRLLAFTFLRGRAYETVEQTTEAKNHEYCGKITFYSGLAYSVSHLLKAHHAFDDLNHADLQNKLMQWMKSHWEEKTAADDDRSLKQWVEDMTSREEVSDEFPGASGRMSLQDFLTSAKESS